MTFRLALAWLRMLRAGRRDAAPIAGPRPVLLIEHLPSAVWYRRGMWAATAQAYGLTITRLGRTRHRAVTRVEADLDTIAHGSWIAAYVAEARAASHERE